MFCSRLERHFLIFFDWHFQKFDRSDQPRSKFKAYLGATKQIRDKKGLRWKVADMIQDKKSELQPYRITRFLPLNRQPGHPPYHETWGQVVINSHLSYVQGLPLMGKRCRSLH